jgi:SAM-dependent methyltransferase
MIASVVPSSFKDPSGFLFVRDGTLYRQVGLSFSEQFDAFVESGLQEALWKAGLLIPHEEVDPALAPAPHAYKVLRPERVGFVSYPYEWCFSQLKNAALATLTIQSIALDFGMSLRDATAYNIQFHNGRPILIDTLSFEKLREGEPWVAYRQFCQHFLAPLALMAYRDVRLGRLSQVHIDGVPLDLAAELLPARARLHPSLFLHVFAHARSQRRHGRDSGGETPSSNTRRRAFSPRAFRGLIDSLRKAVTGLSLRSRESSWAGYYQEAESYTEEAIRHKKEIVAEFLASAAPRSVWDLGANTGLFSRLASDRGISTVAFDMDPEAVEINYRNVASASERDLLPLVMDLTAPSPDIGWANQERRSLAERGPVDTVMALALVHHLAIGNNLPLDRLAEFLRALCSRLVIEFVPKSDPKVMELLSRREDVFDAYTEEGFEDAFQRLFVIERRQPIRSSMRTLYLMRGR